MGTVCYNVDHSWCPSDSISDSDAKSTVHTALARMGLFPGNIYIRASLTSSLTLRNGIPTHSLAKLSAMIKASLTLNAIAKAVWTEPEQFINFHCFNFNSQYWNVVINMMSNVTKGLKNKEVIWPEPLIKLTIKSFLHKETGITFQISTWFWYVSHFISLLGHFTFSNAVLIIYL